jgi:hypothetical protein
MSEELFTKFSADDLCAHLCGWLAPDEAARAWQEIQANESTAKCFVPFALAQLVGEEYKRTVLWDFTIKVLGGHTKNYAQQIGDCVSFGMKNAMEYLQCVEIARLGQAEKFRPIFPPYVYGISRVQIGGGRIGGDGSNGSWAAAGVVKYGLLASDESQVPPYSGSVARSWGRSGPPDSFITVGKMHLVKSAAKVTSAQQVKEAICNGYPVTAASGVGFNRMTRRNGKVWGVRSGSWPHQMCFVGWDDADDGTYCLNSWGEDAHPTPENGDPPGGFWVEKDDVERMVSEGDSFAISQFDGFPRQRPRHWFGS